MYLRNALSFAVISAFAIVAMTSTNLTAGNDTRNLLDLTTAEKTNVRSEMRKLLVSVSDILLALNGQDMAGVEAAARRSGMVMAGTVEVSLKAKLTPAFMKLGKSVHVGFDQIADAARDGASQSKIIELLARQTNRCTSCHAAFGLK